jgi:hypothetical protein
MPLNTNKRMSWAAAITVAATYVRAAALNTERAAPTSSVIKTPESESRRSARLLASNSTGSVTKWNMSTPKKKRIPTSMRSGDLKSNPMKNRGKASPDPKLAIGTMAFLIFSGA